MNKLSPTAKRTPLPLQEGYVDWSPVKATVELIQNYLDAADKGYTGEVKRTHGDKLIIRNDGAEIHEGHVPLGATNKRHDGDTRGKFGEGMKLAFLCLINADKEIAVRSGEERWFPKMAPFEGYGRDPILYLDRRQIQRVDHAEITIHPFTEDEYARLTSRVLALQDDVQKHTCDAGSMLVDEPNRGKLFVRGLYVCPLTDVTGDNQAEFAYGYNLQNIELDRDRRMASPFDVKIEIRRVIRTLVQSDKVATRDIYNIMQSGDGEADILGSDFERELGGSLASYFKSEHGDDAIPVTSTSEAMEARHYGKRPVEVSSPLHTTMTTAMDDLESVKSQMGKKARTTHQFDQLSDDEQINLMLVDEYVTPLDNAHIVTFYDDDRRGYYEDGDIYLAKRICSDRQQLIATVVHEQCHEAGEDGTRAHRDAVEQTFAGIIIDLMEDQ